MKTIWPVLSSTIFFFALVLWGVGLAEPAVILVWGTISLVFWFFWFIRGDWS